MRILNNVLDKITVNVINKEINKELSIDCFSHYTCIFGKDSGEGKTQFYSEIEDGLLTESIEIEVTPQLPFTLATATTIEAILENPQRQVILIDEGSMLKQSVIKKVNNTKHVFISISRAMPLKMEYPLKGIYFLKRDDNWYKLEKDTTFQFFRKDKITELHLF